MIITSVKWSSAARDAVLVNGTITIPYPIEPINDPTEIPTIADVDNWAQTNTIEAEDPVPTYTNAELVDLAGPVVVAFIKAYAQREGVSLQQIRDAIVAQM